MKQLLRKGYRLVQKIQNIEGKIKSGEGVDNSAAVAKLSGFRLEFAEYLQAIEQKVNEGSKDD